MSSKSFHNSLQSYKAGDYHEALVHSNEAVAWGGQNLYQILDTRAAVHAKLGQYKEALKDAKKTIDIAPDRWQGYARAARLFLSLNKVESAKTMIMMALERLKETETERRASLLSLRAEIESTRDALDMLKKRLTNHINQLPIEVFGEIAGVLVEDDHTALIRFLHVCKRWRTVLENSPHLWAKLVLTSRRPKAKAKCWIQRSNGKVKQLVVKSGASASGNWSGDWLDGLHWDNLLLFHSEGWSYLPYLRSIGKEAAASKWIDLAVEDIDTPIPLLPAPSAHFSLQSLSLKNLERDTDVRKLCEQIRDLRSCSICNCHARPGSWADILHTNPRIEELELHVSTSDAEESLPSILALDHLTTLKITYLGPKDIFTARMPNLRKLMLATPRHSLDAFILHLSDTLVGGLTELKLFSCKFSTSTLLHLLRQSPNLQVLEVTSIASGVASLLDALSAHYIPPSFSGARMLTDDQPTDPPPILCPKLTHVNFSRCPEVQAGLLMRLIKSRLIGDSQSQPTEVAKIESLIIDVCPNVEKEWVKRMEELVPHVSCHYLTKKMAKGRISGPVRQFG